MRFSERPIAFFESVLVYPGEKRFAMALTDPKDLRIIKLGEGCLTIRELRTENRAEKISRLFHEFLKPSQNIVFASWNAMWDLVYIDPQDQEKRGWYVDYHLDLCTYSIASINTIGQELGSYGVKDVANFLGLKVPEKYYKSAREQAIFSLEIYKALRNLKPAEPRNPSIGGCVAR